MASTDLMNQFGVPVPPLMEPLTGPREDLQRSGDDIIPVTPDDENDLETPARAIYLGVAGDLRVIMASGKERLIPEGVLAAGVQHSLRIRRVMDTDTTATDIWVVI